jgi:uncharacterized protein YlxP (DUF503 family)
MSSRRTSPAKSPVKSDACIGVLFAELHFPGNRSLKEKRAPLASLRDVVQGRFHAAFAVAGGQDSWQRAEVLIVAATSSLALVRERLDEIERYLHGREFEVSRTLLKTAEPVGTLWDIDC